MFDDIQIGPFTYGFGRAQKINGMPTRLMRMEYGGQLVAEKLHSVADGVGMTQYELLNVFADERADFVRKMREENAPARINLIDFATDELVACFDSYDMCGMTPGLINDSSTYWIRSADRKYSRNVSIYEFARLVAAHEAPKFGWVAGLLPDDVLSTDADAWRAPTSRELRHVVGEGSFTGVTGAKAAELVGVMPQNFRKYTARDDAATRQKISFAMWHLLLHKLGVQAA